MQNNGEKNTIKLGSIKESESFKAGDFEFIVLEQSEGTTAVLLKDLYRDDVIFGSNNNFDGSGVDEICKEFEKELAEACGEENIIMHTVDLTADDGLKDYGEIERKVSLITANQARKYVEILDKHKIDKWWWLSTPHSTATHGNAYWVKCVSPSGSIFNYDYFDNCGVRPFCILNSDILVSI